MKRAVAIWAIAAALPGCSCGDEANILIVNVRTDYVPGVEFVGVRNRLGGAAPIVEDRTAYVGVDFITGQRVAELTPASPGTYTLDTELTDPTGRVIARKPTLVEIRGRRTITVVLARGDETCTNDADCVATAACARGVCALGECLQAPIPGECEPDEYCSIDEGECRPLPGVPTDAGGTDAGAPDAGPDPRGEIVTLALGSDSSCVLRSSGTVECWGGNAFGQLGTSGPPRPTPAPVPGIEDAVELVLGGSQVCVRRGSGEVLCWGENRAGQLGRGTVTFSDEPEPLPVMGIGDAVALGAGYAHVCAILSSGEVVCWGNNIDGQLGDGTTVDRSTPVGVSGSLTAVAIDCGTGHTCARLPTGSLQCWGDNTQGQLGDGSTTRRTSPVAVAGIADAQELRVGNYHTCARRSSGQIVCWGDGRLGAIGDGASTDRASPTPVTGLPDVVTLSAGGSHTCARRSAGTVSCWGYNLFGQIGDGTTTDRPSPVAVTGLTDAAEVSVGFTFSCAVRASDDVVCWGANESGQLGDGTTTERHTPVTVIGW